MIDPDDIEQKGDAEIAEKVNEIFDLRPAKIVKRFGLKNPIYEPTASYGHFGKESYTETVELIRDGKTVKEEITFFGWEKLDMIEPVKKAFNL